jgi:HAD superfamily hydrolase (TIGR01490 family)
MSRPFAAFDIDGTIIRWQLYHAIADDMVKAGLISRSDFQHVHDIRMQWKNRDQGTSFDDYEGALVKLIQRTIPTMSVEDLEAACQRVLDEYKDQVYTYTRDLIQELRTKNYLLFAISGSQKEIVGLIASYYGFDDFGGTVYETNAGRFTGKSDPLRSTRKPEFLKELVAKHDASWQGSIAVGDSESDIPMLSIVEQPIAFNPSKALFAHAKDHRWNIVVERKNMIYQLEPHDESYLLA